MKSGRCGHIKVFKPPSPLDCCSLGPNPRSEVNATTTDHVRAAPKPARNLGLGADQTLEADALLADGKVVTASVCENADPYRSLGGAGPGYGITLSATVKARPNVNVVAAQRLSLSLQPRASSSPGANTSSSSTPLNAWATVHEALLDLNDAGFTSVGSFVVGAVGPRSYMHKIWAIGKSIVKARAAFGPTRATLFTRLGDTVAVSESYASCREKQEQAAVVVMLLSACGGRVRDGRNPNAGLHPAWRTSSFLTLVGKGVPPGNAISSSGRREVMDDVTYPVGGAADEAGARDRGVHERGRNDPDYVEAFYGGPDPERHLAAERKYDPCDVFYCPRCVEAEEWVERPDALLCRRG
ncbi:hypothetical protein DL765_000160 [Monosporascus sp. GIB2]|nr:hypothetical protein DL765_000160 [Monosporascus sp. GIB2]